MIKAFYVTSITGISLLSWKQNKGVELDEQLFAGLFSAIDRLSESMTGSSVETFQSKEGLFNVKRITPNINLIVLTPLDTDSEFISSVFDRIADLLKEIDFFNQQNLTVNFFGEETELYKTVKAFIEQINQEYSLKVRQRSQIDEIGSIKLIFDIFGKDSIYLWRSILLGKRIIITSAYEEQTEKIVSSLLLFNPNAAQYFLFPKFDVQILDELNGKSSYILGTNSSFILMMRKDLWDLHVDLDGKEIKSQHEELKIEKAERELFSEVLNMIEVGDPSEEILRESLTNINSQLMTILRLLKESTSNLKQILKKFSISNEYYTKFLSKLDLDEIL